VYKKVYIKQVLKNKEWRKVNNCLCTTSWLKSYNHTDACYVQEENACVYDA